MPASIFCRVYPVQRDWKLRNENTFQRGHEDVQALLMSLEPLRDATHCCPYYHCTTRASFGTHPKTPLTRSVALAARPRAIASASEEF